MKKSLVVIFFVYFINSLAFSQNNTQNDSVISEKVSFGLGLGMDYGGYGVHGLYYPQKNLGLFVGIGDALAGVGFNVGLKLRFISDHNSQVSPYLIGMYGYNTAIDVVNATQYNKLYYGPTFGLGLDFRFRHYSNGYWTFAILVPVRNSDPSNYMNNLQNNDNISFSNGLSSVDVSVGYNIILSY